MVLETANYDFEKAEWVSKNCDIWDYIRKRLYQQYNIYKQNLTNDVPPEGGSGEGE